MTDTAPEQEEAVATAGGPLAGIRVVELGQLLVQHVRVADVARIQLQVRLDLRDRDTVEAPQGGAPGLVPAGTWSKTDA